MVGLSEVDLLRTAGSLLRSAGVSGSVSSFEMLAPGGNNRVYRVETAHGPFLMKEYFSDPQDPRDRLGKEFAFLRLAWDRGLRCVPQPLAQDTEARAGLYGFVSGRRLLSTEATSARVDEALAFYLRLNALRGTPEAAALTPGSEASFSLQDHFQSFRWRAEQLISLEPAGAAGAAVRALVREILDEHWPSVMKRTLAAYDRLGFDPSAPLPRKDWRLSPSDFGFHNALLREDGTLCFLDFEYAGWDDPAKMVCDFFLQPKVPVSREDFRSFAEGVAAETGDPERSLSRFQAILPVHRLKWCCLLLNEFLPVGRKRRGFAAGDSAREEEVRQTRQLEKAKEYLSRLGSD